MITDKRILKKLEAIGKRYIPFCFERVADVPMEMCETREHFRSEPGRSTKVKWRPAPIGTKWGGPWISAWLRGDVTLPKRCDGKKTFVRARTNVETLFLVDGEHRGVFDRNHTYVAMTVNAKARRKYHLDLEAYAGHPCPGCTPNENRTPPKRKGCVFEGVEVALEREDVSAFLLDLLVLHQLAEALDENSLRQGAVVRGLVDVFAAIDAMPAETPEESWRPKLKEARRIMRPLLDAKNGTTMPLVGLIGHSHLDTAWLWPLSETWRKAARTFSSALNLMEQYPEFMFIQSAPCHAEKMRSEYPGIFKRMREMVTEGRWEPNGAMWVEPDCNIPSGESFVRQFLFGLQATRDMFSYAGDTLWLPDVFGFSGALPQIMRGCNVEFFCTAKMEWNDTTRMPYDSFLWQGIDGTTVIAHFNDLCHSPDPATLTNEWNYIQHKDAQDRHLLAYGFGDGGGGPQAEAIEVARRVEDLEGCPRTRTMSVSDFMKSLRDEMKDLPTWAGELYFEYHRGTLTSIAEIKRGNRKMELALRDAELLGVLAALRGARYPADKLRELWKVLLLNQFHDILPGSSIARVNDEAMKSFAEGIGGANDVAESALKTLAGAARTTSKNMLVVNTLSWERDGEFTLDNAAKGMVPDCPGATAQWVEDVEGRRRLVVQGVKLPALGAAPLRMKKGKPSGASAFKVSARKVETPCAVIRFDKTGRIVSFVEKSSGRDIVRKGGAVNSFLIGEDIPESWDNWDIDSDQRLKMQHDNRLVKREVVADGPLQLRIRSKYELGCQSAITQDMVFHANMPRVDFETVVDWREKHKLLKASFDFDILADFARHEIQYGHIERPTHQNLPVDRARFEVCAHKWTDISDNGFGVAVLNDCKYGVSVDGGKVGLSLIKSGTHPDERGDAGRHRFTYSLLPHACGFSVESVVRPAYELNAPPRIVPAGAKAKGFDGLINVDAPNVIVETIKWAEEGNAVVARLYEAGKAGVFVNVAFDPRIKTVSETNMLEEDAREMKLETHRARMFFRPFEVKTLYCAV